MNSSIEKAFLKIIYFSLVIFVGTGCVSEINNSEIMPPNNCIDIAEQIAETTPMNWLNEHSEQPRDYDKRIIVMPRYYYELGPRELPLAVKELKSIPIKELSYKEAKYFNQHYRQEVGMKPYLIRAVFSGYTGELFVVISDDTLRIISNSLGASVSPSFTPLVINLSNKPKNLVLELSNSL